MQHAMPSAKSLKGNATSPPARIGATPMITHRYRTCALSDVNAYGRPSGSRTSSYRVISTSAQARLPGGRIGMGERALFVTAH